MLKQIIALCGVGLTLVPNVQAEVNLNQILKSEVDCKTESIANAFACGKISGRLNTLYYSTHDAYFEHNLNQDTITTGGYLKYETQPYLGLSAGVSYAGQRRLDDKYSGYAEVSELKNDKDGLGEAYLDWKNQDWSVRLGQQTLDIPFVGNYDWRVMPPLFRAADVQYGHKDDYIRVSWIDRFKSYADDEFTKTSRYSGNIETDGMLSLGLAKSFDLSDKQLKAQAWYQSYFDYSDVVYLEGHLKWKEIKYQPDLGLQAMFAQDQGEALAGKVDHQGFGTVLALNILDNVTIKTAYNYIHKEADAYMNGALFVPYMIYTSSGPYFAQPFFTSTQDLGSGHAYMLAIEGPINDQLYVGANYSFMDLTDPNHYPDLANSQGKSWNQSEYVIYGFYNFTGALKGWSLANFFGVNTSPRSDDVFLQNRFGVKYQF